VKFAKIATALLALALQVPTMAAVIPVKLFKNPNCFCCDLYAKHLEQNGFKVELVNTTDMDAIKQKYGIPERLDGCHTAIVDGYIVEGLVPAKFVQQMLKDRPKIKGIALPGMPTGAPGMDGPKSQPLQVFTLERGPAAASAAPKVYGSF
jgi:hypothetical protein